jgi:hypothetical protein
MMISLFPRRQEQSLVYFTYLALPVCLLILLLEWGAPSWFNQLLMALACVMFLNSVHHGMAVATMFSVDEFRQLIREKNAKNRIGFWPMFTFIFAASALSFLLIKKIIPLPPGVYTNYFLIWSVLEFSTSQWHQVSQTKGLSLLYNRALDAAGHGESLKRKPFERIERHLYDALILILAVTTAGGFFNRDALRFWGFVAGAVVAAAIVAVAFLTPGSAASYKKHFSMRVLFYPLSAYSFYSHIATRINHGIEYLFVYLRVLRQTTSNRQSVVLATLFFGGIAGLLALYNYHTGILPIIYGRTHATMLHEEILQALAFGRSISHYYVDRTLFSFRFEENRRLVGPFFRTEDPVPVSEAEPKPIPGIPQTA